MSANPFISSRAQADRSGSPEIVDQSIVQRFDEHVRRAPDRPAVIADDGVVSYGELDRRASALARCIVDRIGPDPCAVAVLLDQGPAAVMSILAILKAGKWFVPLDPESPAELLREQIAHAEARLVLCEATTQKITSPQPWSTLMMDIMEAGREVRDDAPLTVPSANDMACVFYTSGSTGAPKGVVDLHQNVVHNVSRYTELLRITSDDRLSLIQPCAFSGTLSSLFGALLNGAAVCPYSLRRHGISGLTSWLRAHRISIFHSVPSIFRGMLRPDSWLPDVRVVRLEGDRAMKGELELFKRHFRPRSMLAVGLGATETGLTRQWRADHTTFWPGGGLPLGYPVPDVEISIRDEDGRALPAGETGEIWVHSGYLAKGYWRDEPRTREAFFADPAGNGMRIYRTGDLGCMRRDGCLEFKGRRGQRLKIRGEWVDLTDVENALSALSGVADAAVVVQNHGDDPKLTAFVVPCPGVVLAERELRAALRRHYAGAAIPSQINIVDRLPRSRHHKIDRSALREGKRPGQADLPDRLLKIWRDVIGNDELGFDDDFFAAGGDSMVAALICALIADEFDVDLPGSIFRTCPSVARLADHMRRLPPHAHRSRLVPLKPGGDRPPLFIIPSHFDNPSHFADLATAMPEDQPVYACRFPRADSVQEMARALLADIGSRQTAGPYYLAGHCYGGMVAWEMAAQLIDKGEQIGLLVLVAVGPREFPGLLSSGHRRRLQRDERLMRMRHILKLLLRRGQRSRLALVKEMWQRRRFTKRSPEMLWLQSLRAKYSARPLGCPVELLLPQPALGDGRRDDACWKEISSARVGIHRFAPEAWRLFDSRNAPATAHLLDQLMRGHQRAVT